MKKGYPKAKIKMVLALRERNMTYAQIAKKVGVSKPTIGNWLRAHSKTKEYKTLESKASPKQITNALKALRTFRTALGSI